MNTETLKPISRKPKKIFTHSEKREKAIANLIEYLMPVIISDDDNQNKHTPLPLCESMVSRINGDNKKSVLVFYNLELVISLVTSGWEGEITLFTASKNKVEAIKKLNKTTGYNIKTEYIGGNNPLFYLEMNLDSKFDIIIGNPPYQRDKGNNKIANGLGNLYLDFIKRSSSLLKEGGELLFIGPINYLKATNFSEKTDGFSNLSGLEILEIENGIEKHFSKENVGKKVETFISLIHCKKSDSASEEIRFNGGKWDLRSFPFIFARGESDMIDIFKEIWPKMTDISLGERLDIRRVSPDKIRENFDISRTSMAPRVYRDKDLIEKGILKWGNGDNIGNQTQIVNLSLSIDESNILFSSKLFRIVLYLSYTEPTVYHNFLRGIVKPKSLVLTESTTEEEIISSYGISPQVIEKIMSVSWKK